MKNETRFNQLSENEIQDTITGFLIFKVLSSPDVWRVVKAKGYFAEMEGTLRQCKSYVKNLNAASM